MFLYWVDFHDQSSFVCDHIGEKLVNVIANGFANDDVFYYVASIIGTKIFNISILDI
jgi:hypothetical protein